MGIQKKHGKGRLDKWYKLAKEKGYRARAAFKLVQLNRKYGFLEKSKVLLDLCAAPGSWCQVAAETMPANSLIVGVDLAPIKPIPRTITFQSDITTDKCRATIRQHFKTWKADTVLHDGAPNVGTAWVQDAYSQAELVLQSLKLATEFLVAGGTFVTKVFRSKDYNALLWVFNQLFRKVEATKPPSSRNVSAEIFVVCREYKAPKHIDPKFLDPRAVFAELSDPTPNNEAKVFNPEKKKRRREGYEEGDYTQYKETLATDFIHTTDPIAILGSVNRLTFEAPEDGGHIALTALSRLPETTDEIRQCCLDLKVLGRKEFRLLLRWRLQVREIFGLGSKKKANVTDMGDEVAEIAPMDEEEQIQAELEKLDDQASSRRKRQRRRENEKKQKEIVRMQMNMTTPSEIGLDQATIYGESSMFALKAVDKAGAIDKVARGRMAVPVQNEKVQPEELEDETSDDEQDALDEELDQLYDEYRERKSEADAKYRARQARTEDDDGEWEGVSDDARSSDEDFEDDESEDDHATASNEDGARDDAGHLIFPRQNNNFEANGLTRRAAQFFEQDIFKDLGHLAVAEDNDSAVDMGADHSSNDETAATVPSVKGSRKERNFEAAATKTVKILDSNRESDSDGESSILEMDDAMTPSSSKQYADESEDEEQNSFEVVKSTMPSWDQQAEPLKEDGRPDIDIITAEAMTLAQQLASGEKRTHDLMDDGFNRYSFRDVDGLPEWFLDDEGRHSKPQRPITAAGAAAIKEKLRALNARPMKKVQEAKDRKKFRAARRLEKLRKKSALVAEEEGVSEADKARSIAKLMSNAAKKGGKGGGKKGGKQQVKLVVATGGNKGIAGRPRGVKGKYKIVDARLKKDARAEKRLAKARRKR